MEAILYVIFVGIPSACLYGLIFLIVRFLLQLKWPDSRATYAAIVLIVGAAFLLPIYGNVVTNRDFRAARSLDTLPSRPIQLSGNIRIEDRGAYVEKCVNLCLALIRTPGVTSVTIDARPFGAATFKMEDGVIVGESPIPESDFRLVITSGIPADHRRTGQGDVETRLLPRPLYPTRFEIFDRTGNALLRQSAAHIRSIKLPMLIVFSLSPHE